MSGTIKGVEDHGTIVVVTVEDDAGRVERVAFDHRMFSHVYDGEGGNILGRAVEVHGDPYEQTVEFLD